MLPNNMQHQYWVTKKSVLRKLGGKEEDCIISSDAELDAKLELFKSINESCVQLQKIIDLYQERLCYLAQEENALGRYLKECGKNEKNSSAGQLMATAGKALAYCGHQRLTIRPPLVRLHHEVETFRVRAVTDTRETVSEMEKARTEYRAALSWMKSVSNQLDPDTGHGLDSFRKAQGYVKTSKTKFDKYTLACLQKVDLLAAARCNMFSHALVSYQNALYQFATKALETLSLATTKLQKVEPYDFSIVAELTESPTKANKSPTNDKSTGASDEDSKEANLIEDKDRNTFFNSEYTDNAEKAVKKELEEEKSQGDDINKPTPVDDLTSNLLGEDFAAPLRNRNIDQSKPSSDLLDFDWSMTDPLIDVFGNMNSLNTSNFDMIPSRNVIKANENKEEKSNGNKSHKTESQISWLSLFAELDPLANGVMENNVSGDRA